MLSRRGRSGSESTVGGMFTAGVAVAVVTSCMMIGFGLYVALGPDRNEAWNAEGSEVEVLTEESSSALEGRLTRFRVIVELSSHDVELVGALNEFVASPSQNARTETIASLFHMVPFFTGGISKIEIVDRTGQELAVLHGRTGGGVEEAAGITHEGEDLTIDEAFDSAHGSIHQSVPYSSSASDQWVVSLATPIDTVGGRVVLNVEIPVDNLSPLLHVKGMRSVLLAGADGAVLFDSKPTATLPDEVDRLAADHVAGDPIGWGRHRGGVFGYASFDGAPGGEDWLLILIGSNSVGLFSTIDTGTVLVVVLGVLGIVGAMLSLHEHRRRIAESLSDELTGLGNRRHLRISFASLSRAQSSSGVAVALLDLNRFKEVNDALGHSAGDELLRLVARELTNCLRGDERVARIGGDEFVVVAPRIPGVEPSELGTRLYRAVATQYLLSAQELLVGLSVGVALTPDHGTELDEVLRRADAAMYHAKRRGGGAVVYEPSLERVQSDRLAVAARLRMAMHHHQVEVHYQPIVDRDRNVHGVEALLRWPASGLGPMEIVEAAEASGLMSTVTDYVIDRALAQASRWQAAGYELTTAVNLAAGNLMEHDLAERVEIAAAIHGVDPSRLEFEVTESVMIADRAAAERVTDKLVRLGATVGIDDYGTANAGIGYLKGLSARFVKIDRSIAGVVAESEADAAIVASTVSLAHSLGMVVVAEGVEDEATAHRLIELGCDRLQGYYFGRPSTAEALTATLARPADDRRSTAG